ncbi:GAF domain-containing protein [Candidatus Falkowbacteria bacterium]|nr:GAF domain-containing protein [Candidatus Falkowbacteria bacterium]
MLGFIFLILIILLFSSLFYFIFKQGSKSAPNRSLSLMIVSIILWSLVNYFENETKNIQIAQVLLYLDFIFGPFITYFFLKFCLVFTQSKLYKYNKIYYAFTLLIIFFVIFGFVIKNIRFFEGTLVFDPGFFYLFYSIILFLDIILGIFVLFREYLKAQGLYKVQLLYVILGLLISGILGLITNLILPQLGVINLTILRLGIYGMIFFIGLTSYAILKYRLMDVRVIIRRSAVFTVLVLIITALYAVLSYALSVFFTQLFGIESLILNGVIMAVLVALGFEPLKTWLSYVTDSFLFKAEYKPQEVLQEFSAHLTTTLDLYSIRDFILSGLQKIFKNKFTSLFLLNEERGVYAKLGDIGKVAARLDTIDKKLFSKISNYLADMGKERDTIVREEVKKIYEYQPDPIMKLLIDQMERYEVNLIIPLYLRDKLVGILFLGDKKSGDVYSQQDIRVLEIISGQSAVAIQNAQLFEEQKHFAEHLKMEVDKATKELKVANIQLKKLDQAKSEFISIASHQLRTPLTAIKGYLSMVQQGDYGKIPAKFNAPIDRVLQSTERIIHLVEDLLNISRIESGRMQFDFALTDLNALAEDVYSELMVQAKKKNLQFEYIKPTKSISKLSLDQNKIREVIMNLTDNAIKYTPKGFVTMKLERLDDSVRFSVTDSGRGLEADEIPLLFQKFSRARGVQLIHTEGTGLGLYIAKNIIEKHNGRIWVESKGKDKGSTFYIEFKIKK